MEHPIDIDDFGVPPCMDIPKLCAMVKEWFIYP